MEILGEGKLPLRRSKANASGLLVEIAEVVVDGGIGLIALHGLAQVFFGQFILAQLEVGPAERVEVGAVHRFDVQRLCGSS